MPRPGFVLFAYVALAWSVSVGGAAANRLPTVPSRGGGECSVLRYAPHLRGLWLGHFTGGRFVRFDGLPPRIDWLDQYSCFPTRAACSRWQRDLLHTFSRIQGYKTCLPLR